MEPATSTNTAKSPATDPAIAAHLGFARGPVDAWAWTTEAASG
jgi:hypothetical protein